MDRGEANDIRRPIVAVIAALLFFVLTTTLFRIQLQISKTLLIAGVLIVLGVVYLRLQPKDENSHR